MSLVGALLSWGFHPVRTTGGATVAAGHALGLVVAAYAVYLLPVLVIASFAFFLSTVTRNSAAALVGALLFALGFQLVAALPGIGSVKHYLLPAQFNAWESLFGRGDGDALIARAAWTCALYAGIPLLAGWLYFRRRDVARNRSRAESAGEPTVARAPVPVLLIALLGALVYWGSMYIVEYGGEADARVHYPYTSFKEIQDLQPKGEEEIIKMKGLLVYSRICAGCHQNDGNGSASQNAPRRPQPAPIVPCGVAGVRARRDRACGSCRSA